MSPTKTRFLVVRADDIDGLAEKLTNLSDELHSITVIKVNKAITYKKVNSIGIKQYEALVKQVEELA